MGERNEGGMNTIERLEFYKNEVCMEVAKQILDDLEKSETSLSRTDIALQRASVWSYVGCLGPVVAYLNIARRGIIIFKDAQENKFLFLLNRDEHKERISEVIKDESYIDEAERILSGILRKRELSNKTNSLSDYEPSIVAQLSLFLTVAYLLKAEECVDERNIEKAVDYVEKMSLLYEITQNQVELLIRNS